LNFGRAQKEFQKDSTTTTFVFSSSHISKQLKYFNTQEGKQNSEANPIKEI